MSEKDPAKLRLELARMHWALGERAEAVGALERAARQGADLEGMLALVDGCLEELEAGDAVDLAAKLAGLRARTVEALARRDANADLPAPLATPTMVRLLADQGHADKALAVADDLLRRNPGDVRVLAARESITARPARRSSHARTIAELERWLANLASRKQGGAFA